MENIMGKSFNLNSFRFAQMKIDEETGEILEEEVPKDFQQSFAHDKYVINLGKRQEGRLITTNINTIQINKKAILKAVQEFKYFTQLGYNGIYGNGQAAKKIISTLKNSDK